MSWGAPTLAAVEGEPCCWASMGLSLVPPCPMPGLLGCPQSLALGCESAHHPIHAVSCR